MILVGIFIEMVIYSCILFVLQETHGKKSKESELLMRQILEQKKKKKNQN